MYLILGKPRSLAQHNTLQFVRDQSIPRDRVPILIIDDQPFPYKSLLQNLHFNMTQLEDVTDIRSVEAYPIILCDIRGVGKAFESKFEGAYLLAQLRRIYPQKFIVAYTAQTYDASYNQYLQLADQVVKKDIGQEEWSDKLDKAISTVNNPTYLWKRIRNSLLEMDIPLVELVELEDQFIGFVQQKTKSFPSKGLSSQLPDNAKPLLESVVKTVHLLTGK